MRRRVVAVIGASDPPGQHRRLAYRVGRLLAKAGLVVATGGLGGVMEEASRGARAAGGLVLGVLPGADPKSANPYVDIAVATGMGEARNAVLVRTADGLIAVSRGYGTLSEIAFALKQGKPIVGLKTWELPELETARTPEEAVRRLLARMHDRL